MKKKFKFIFLILFIILCCLICCLFTTIKDEVRTIKSEKQLSKIYDEESYEINEYLINFLTMPFSFFVRNELDYSRPSISSGFDYVEDTMALNTYGSKSVDTSNVSIGETSTKDYSTTNIQVENVDEADITKTDGDYIYSLSESDVVITDVKNPAEIKIASKITSSSGKIPEDLILYKDKLVVIYEDSNSSSSYYYNNRNNTIVKIYDITDKTNPKLVKDYELYEPYYTSRCINNVLYVISTGELREEYDKVLRKYTENNRDEEIKLSDIKYLKNVKTTKQTLISVADLDDTDKKIDVSSYLIDISNAYVSENSIYLLDSKYEYSYSSAPPIKSMFGPKGIIGVFTYDDDDDNYDSGRKTEIYKFDIKKDGKVDYSTKTKVTGETINQYSLDEYNGHLRVALHDSNGARVVILDDKLNQIGVTKDIAKGEKMYSSRFMGNKVYLVTYKNMDPLFVIDLSDEKNPKVLGELSIPGYSTYLHPYDENHLIGIGMETKETTTRDTSGRVRSTSARIVGMKMALFDVSDVRNPVQMSQTVIGDSRTTSAILTNPKALLFSKEKELIAIPVNNYNEDFEVETYSDEYSTIIDDYTDYDKECIGEGYFVYNINLKKGFDLKGVITHEKTKSKYSYYNVSRLLRGLYIDDNLYTVSESAVKVNDLKNLNSISELNLINKEHNSTKSEVEEEVEDDDDDETSSEDAQPLER